MIADANNLDDLAAALENWLGENNPFDNNGLYQELPDNALCNIDCEALADDDEFENRDKAYDHD